MQNKNGKIKVTKDGPYIVSGKLPLVKEIIISDENGDSTGYERQKNYDCADEYALCRCGRSKNPPFCDGTHARVGFDGTETASFGKIFDHCEMINGPDLDLQDLPKFCARARFCHNQKGDVWGNTEQSDDPKLKKEAIRQACLCPAGRLVARKKSGQEVEPKLDPEVGLIEDQKMKVSGPIWAKGGIEIESAAGQRYETRNRVTLCRCGKSRNKPFCDSRHIDSKFNDGDESLE